MSSAYSQVDLSLLPAPSVVESLSFEAIFAEIVADLQARASERGLEFSALVESDPAYLILEAAAYREVLIRQRVNEAARSVMLAFATGADLDNIAANYGVARLVVTPADDSAIPPVAAVYETDEALRTRVTLSPEGYTTAGSSGSYVFHALSASGQVKDVAATSPVPGAAVIYILAQEGDGSAPETLLDTVAQALNADTVRPITDQVEVLAGSIVNYTVRAELEVPPGPDATVVQRAAEAAARAYAESRHRLGADVTLSGLYAALHQPGVEKVNLFEPAGNLDMEDGEAPYCTALDVSVVTANG